MPCAGCGRQDRRLKIARGPDGRLLFNRCEDCLHALELQALGLAVTQDAAAIPRSCGFSEKAWGSIERSRAVGLRMIGAILVVWAIVLEIVAADQWLANASASTGLGPTGVRRGPIFAVSGGILAVFGGWIELISIERGRRRDCALLAVEILSVVGGLTVLGLGIVYHDKKRGSLIILLLGIAVAAAVASRRSRKQSLSLPPKPSMIP